MTSTIKKGARITGPDRDRLAADLKRRYEAGETVRSLAASIGRSYGFVNAILRDAGVTLRPRGGAHRTASAR